jgi:hypothetical protein
MSTTALGEDQFAAPDDRKYGLKSGEAKLDIRKCHTDILTIHIA